MKKKIINTGENVVLYDNDSLRDRVASSSLITQAVHMYYQNGRQGTIGCKGRAELVSRSNRKPWKQKGTGRARAGTPRSPLWRGGAVALGPVMRVRIHKMLQKMRTRVLASSLREKINSKKIMSINFDTKIISCKNATIFLKQNNLYDKKIVLFCNRDDKEIYYSFLNLSFITILFYDAIFFLPFANESIILFLEKDRTLFEGVIKKCQ